MYICIYVYMYMYVCTYIYIYIYIQSHRYVYICICICIYVEWGTTLLQVKSIVWEGHTDLTAALVVADPLPADLTMELLAAVEAQV